MARLTTIFVILPKQIGARLAGSPGMVKAEQWGLKTMQESGADKVVVTGMYGTALGTWWKG